MAHLTNSHGTLVSRGTVGEKQGNRLYNQVQDSRISMVDNAVVDGLSNIYIVRSADNLYRLKCLCI